MTSAAVPRGVRTAAASTLVLEAIVVLLSLPVVAKLGGGLSAPRAVALVGLAVALVLVGGAAGRRWAYPAGTVLQLLVIASGLLTLTMAVLGVVFLAVWWSVLWLRRPLSAPPPS